MLSLCQVKELINQNDHTTGYEIIFTQIFFKRFDFFVYLAVQSELDITKSKCRTANMEAEQYKTQVKTKTQELEHINAQLRNKDSSVQQSIAK